MKDRRCSLRGGGWLAALGWLLLLAQPAASAPLSRLDSLRQLPRWPLAAQVRLARGRLTDYAGDAGATQAAAVAETLTQQPGLRLPRVVYLELLGNLAGYYIHVKQPSLATARLLEVRQRAWADSARSGVAATWLSYCYGQLGQARPARFYAREALRRLPPRMPGYSDELGQAYCMLADAAALTHNYPLQAASLRPTLALAWRKHDPVDAAVAYANLAGCQLNQHHLAQAAGLLDSSRQVADVRAYPNVQLLHYELAARLALARHQYRAAERALAPAQPLLAGQPIWEADVLKLLVPALAGQGRYRAAFAQQQRLAALEARTFEEKASRHAQELQISYATARREQQLTRQRQRIAALQAEQRVRAAEYGRRLAGLGAAALAGLLLATLGAGWWVTRQRRLRTEREARLRTRIAADLHDEVGTLLARVSMQADLLSQQQPSPDPALTRLLGNSRAAARTMRDIVWSIDAGADTVGALLDRMRDHLDQTATPAGLLTHLHVENLPDDQFLPPELRQHLYLVFKEAVTNAVRHATHATRLAVSLTRVAEHSSTLVLTVADDGQPGAPPARSGMGLRNMRQRAAALRGHLDAGPLPGGGFRVRLRVAA